MAKRFVMVALCVGALGLASLAAPSTADARGCYRSPGRYYGGPVYGRSFYRGGFYAPYRSYYGGPGFYGGPGYYGGGGFYYGGHRGGVYVRF